MICPRCGSLLGAVDAECRGCGPPAAFIERSEAAAPRETVIEPEVLGSIDEVEGARFTPPAPPVGCAIGPGCGCIGLPLAVLAGVFVSSLVALLWVLSLGRVPASILRLARRGGRGASRG